MGQTPTSAAAADPEAVVHEALCTIARILGRKLARRHHAEAQARAQAQAEAQRS